MLVVDYAGFLVYVICFVVFLLLRCVYLCLRFIAIVLGYFVNSVDFLMILFY